MPAMQVMFTNLYKCFAAIGYQGKEVNNRQDDIRCRSRRVRLCFLSKLCLMLSVVKDC